MAGTNPINTLAPFAEVFQVDGNGTTAVDVWDIPKNTIITGVLCEVVVAATGSANNIIVGDEDDDNGYILAAAVCGATVGTIFGDEMDERGAYTNAGLDLASLQHGGQWKVYTAKNTLRIDCSADGTIEPTVKIYVFGYRVPELSA